MSQAPLPPDPTAVEDVPIAAPESHARQLSRLFAEMEAARRRIAVLLRKAEVATRPSVSHCSAVIQPPPSVAQQADRAPASSGSS